MTRTVSILPIKLAGTSSTARKLVEQLADARQQVVVAYPLVGGGKADLNSQTLADEGRGRPAAGSRR